MKTLLKAPEELDVPEEIQIAAIEGRLTFFIGNGISRLYNIPSWDELANKMLRSLVSEKKIDFNKYDILLKHSTKTKISIADHYFKKAIEENNPKLAYEGLLMKDVPERGTEDYPPSYSLLAKFGCRFLTTNYDPLFSNELKYQWSESRAIKTSVVSKDEKEKSHVAHNKPKDVQVYNSIDEFEKSGMLNGNFLVHIHGSISDEKSLIVSTLDYLNLYGDKAKVDKIKLLLKDQTVVFFGYGLEELEILDIIVRSTRDNQTENANKYFMLLPLLTHEYEIYELLKIYYEEQLGIKLLPYSRDKKDFHSIEDIIDNWAKELSDLVKEPKFDDKLSVLESLLNEYQEAPDEK